MRILALDDEQSYRDLYRDFFGLQDDVELTAVATIDEALAALDRGSFDVVLTDLFVGRGDGRDGRDVAQRIKDQGRQERVIVISGSSSRGLDQLLMALGVEKIFTKPFSLAELWKYLKAPKKG